MFLKKLFSDVLKLISDTYENQRDFAEKSSINRTYLSKYINCSLENPPSPKILQKLANASNGVADYEDLMRICGYISDICGERLKKCRLGQNLSIDEVSGIVGITPEKLTLWENGNNYNMDFETSCKLADLYNVDLNWLIGFKVPKKDTIIYKVKDNSMLPILGIDDIAYIYCKSDYISGETIFFKLDNKEYIRKIIETNNTIELQALNTEYPIIKLSKEDLKKHNFQVLGKVTEARNKSAFK